MQFLDLADYLIPGYSMLSGSERLDFQNTPVGKKFTAIIEKNRNAINGFTDSKWFFQKLIYPYDKEKQQLRQQFEQDKNAFISGMKSTLELKNLFSLIAAQILPSIFPDYCLLDELQQRALAFAPLSQELYQTCYPQISLLTPLDSDHADVLALRKKQIVCEWEHHFRTAPDMAVIRKIIEQKKQIDRSAMLRERMKQLAQFFPLLRYIAPSNDKSSLAQLALKYRELLKKTEDFNLADIERNSLAILLFDYLHIPSAKYLSFIQLQNFNLNQAHILAEKIMRAFNEKTKLNMDEWIEQYQRNLSVYLNTTLCRINGKIWTDPDKTTQQISSSLSNMFWNSEPVNQATEFMNKLSEAHAFLQVTGFSSQNDNIILSILDLYNTHRFAEQVNENKSILLSLLTPFVPLYDEYKDIALYEKNTYRKIFRMMMPLLIIAGFVVLVALSLSPLSLPAFAFAVAMIPTLILGFVLAAQYAKFKNSIYNFFRQYSYGGPFEIPEFQVNERMVNALKSKANAHLIRDFYIQELQSCDRIEALYKNTESLGVLTQLQIATRKVNLSKRHALCMEWYDIHSNIELGCDELPKIIRARLHNEISTELSALQKTLQEEYSEQIQPLITQAATEIKNKIAIDSGCKKGDVLYYHHTLPQTAGMFAPKQTLVHKKRAEQLDAIAQLPHFSL